MSYTINLTNGTVFAVIPDGTVNTSSSMTLIGKNYAGYGQFLDDNFVHLLENSANSSAPAAPLTGQLWWDSTNTLLKVYAGAAGWKGLGGATASATQPSPNILGDLWYDSTNQQLKVCSVAGAPGTFIVVGPAYSSSQGTSGAIPLSINDTGATPHIVTALYANNSLVAIVSPDTNFTPAAPYSTAFPTIFKGTTVWNTGVNAGNIAGASNVTITSAGTTTAVVSPTGVFVTGVTSASGNITGGNILTGGLISATGNITSGNLLNNGLISSTGNSTAANYLTGGLISATGNITGGNISATNHTGTTVSVTGNVTGANFIGNVISPAGSAVSTTGNITGGNILTGGIVSAAGNITSAGNVSGTFFLGNGSQLSGLSLGVTVTKFVNGTTEGNIGASGGNINFNVAGVSNVVVMTTTGLVATGLTSPSITKNGSNAVGNVGSSSNYFNSTFSANYFGDAVSVTGNVTGTNFIGNVIPPAGGAVSTTGNITGGNILTSGIVSAAGNITGGNILGGANVNATTHTGTTVSVTGNITGGNILGGANVNATTHTGTTVSVTGNITGGNLNGALSSASQANITAVGTLTTLSVTGNVTSGNLITAGTTGLLSVNSITHTGTNAVGNIGSSSSYFNQVFATATTALYADVAERFEADELLAPGTVVELGGTKEITRALSDLSEKVFGVISTKPAYTMNGGAGENDTHPPVAMTGRVPVHVVGIIHKGDRLVSAGAGSARAAQPGEATAFNVIGRALVDKLSPEPGTIEAIVTIK